MFFARGKTVNLGILHETLMGEMNYATDIQKKNKSILLY